MGERDGGLRVLVCGGRDYSHWNNVYMGLDDLNKERGIALVICGGAHGVDQYAYDWAISRMLVVLQYLADWKIHGRRAGPLRNQRMIDEGHPDLVIAFPGGAGTADMVRRARKAGIEVIEER